MSSPELLIVPSSGPPRKPSPPQVEDPRSGTPAAPSLVARELGVSPARYVLQIRIEAAQRMLEQSQKGLTQIASACGFSSADAMRRAFMRTLRITPLTCCREHTSAPHRQSEACSPVSFNQPSLRKRHRQGSQSQCECAIVQLPRSATNGEGIVSLDQSITRQDEPLKGPRAEVSTAVRGTKLQERARAKELAGTSVDAEPNKENIGGLLVGTEGHHDGCNRRRFADAHLVEPGKTAQALKRRVLLDPQQFACRNRRRLWCNRQGQSGNC